VLSRRLAIVLRDFHTLADARAAAGWARPVRAGVVWGQVCFQALQYVSRMDGRCIAGADGLDFPQVTLYTRNAMVDFTGGFFLSDNFKLSDPIIQYRHAHTVLMGRKQHFGNEVTLL